MRIRYKSVKTAFPVLSEVKSMTGYIKDGIFIIAFGLGDDREVLFRKTVFDEEDSSRAIQAFNSVQTSLGLNGYANLVAGEMTALLNEDWMLDEGE